MAFNTSRRARHGRPRPSARRGGSGMSGASRAHWASVKSSVRRFIAILQYYHGIYETASSKRKASRYTPSIEAMTTRETWLI